MSQYQNDDEFMRLYFGHHPDFERDHKENRRNLQKKADPEEAFFGKAMPLSSFFDQRHPDIYLIPRNKHIRVVDAYGETLCSTLYNAGYPSTEYFPIPFSSQGFFIDSETEGIFSALLREPLVNRMLGLSQLGYLFLPRARSAVQIGGKRYYENHLFKHTRLTHCLKVAAAGYVLMSQANFSRREIHAATLAFGTHDIGMPGGGESIKRIDPEGFCEEKNYAERVEQSGISRRWEKFGFETEKCHQMVMGINPGGKLLSDIDRIDYTMTDCYHIAFHRLGRIRRLLKNNPLLGDVWQDIRFTRDKKRHYFVNLQRLYLFLLLRAYEHVDFLQNPYCRALDHTLYLRAKKLYDKGLITTEDLLGNDDEWLERELMKSGEPHFSSKISQDDFGWRKFKTQEQAQVFMETSTKRISHCEHIKAFDVGLQTLVKHKGKIMPLGDALDHDHKDMLSKLSKARQGWYVYYFK